jgi:excisionase family DNA binding protein
MESVRLLRVPEAADRLGYSRRTVERLIATGRLRAVRLHEGAPWRVPADALDALVASMETNTPTHRSLRAVR